MSDAKSSREVQVRSHESVDHVHPTDAGLMSPGDEQIPATGIMGDETLVRMTGEGMAPYPGVSDHDLPEHRDDEDAHPGPTRWPNAASDESAGE